MKKEFDFWKLVKVINDVGIVIISLLVIAVFILIDLNHYDFDLGWKLLILMQPVPFIYLKFVLWMNEPYV